MNAARLLVASFLLSSIVVGLVGTLFQPQPPIASAFPFTAYTTTSTSYYYWESMTTSTLIVRTTVSSTLTQKTIDGPYAKIEGTFDYTSSEFSMAVTNLINVGIEGGRISFRVSNLAETVSDSALVNFGKVKVGETIYVKQRVFLSNSYYRGNVKVTPVKVEISCEGVVTQVPFATYVYTQTFTSIMGSVYTLSRVSETALALLVVLLGVGIAVPLLFRSRKKQRLAFPKPGMRAAPGSKASFNSVSDRESTARTPFHEEETGKISVFLARLEELKQRREISDRTYEKLRQEYWKKIEKHSDELKEGKSATEVAQTEPEETAAVFCIHCGAQIRGNARFCHYCGRLQE